MNPRKAAMADRWGSSVDLNSRGTLAAAVILGTVGVLSFIVQPGLVQGFVTELGLTEAAANDLAFVEMVGVAIGTYLVSATARRVSWRLLVAIALMLAALGNLGSAFWPTTGLANWRFVAGLGEGTIIATSFAVIGLTRRLERNLALYLVPLLTYGAIGLWVMPRAFAAIGIGGVFGVWAGLSVLSLVTVRWLPDSLPGVAELRASARQLPWKHILVTLLALLVFNSAIGIAWANLFLIGMQIRPDDQAIANALLLSQFVAIAGALLALLLESRLHRFWPTILGYLGLAATLALLLGDATYAVFVFAVAAFNFLWNLVLPFVLAAVSDMDRTGSIMPRAIAVQMTGLGFGPFIAARILDSGAGLESVVLTTIVMLLASLLLLAWPLAALARSPAVRRDPGSRQS